MRGQADINVLVQWEPGSVDTDSRPASSRVPPEHRLLLNAAREWAWEAAYEDVWGQCTPRRVHARGGSDATNPYKTTRELEPMGNWCCWQARRQISRSCESIGRMAQGA